MIVTTVTVKLYLIFPLLISLNVFAIVVISPIEVVRHAKHIEIERSVRPKVEPIASTSLIVASVLAISLNLIEPVAPRYINPP